MFVRDETHSLGGGAAPTKTAPGGGEGAKGSQTVGKTTKPGNDPRTKMFTNG